MPLHDWTLVPDNVFHVFHVGWIWNLARALNEGLLPAGYVARPEECVGPFEADVLTLETLTLEKGAEPLSAPGEQAPEPAPTLVLAPPRLEARKERRVSVFSAGDERRVAVIEVVSPGNKDSAARAGMFTSKLLECLAAGLHAVVVDLLPGTRPAPGFAGELTREMGDASGKVPLEGRCATSFERRQDPVSVRVFHRTLGLGVALPGDLPLFLRQGFVRLPLEETYLLTVAGLAAVDRARLEPG